jgi:hypothetical protein
MVCPPVTSEAGAIDYSLRDIPYVHQGDIVGREYIYFYKFLCTYGISLRHLTIDSQDQVQIIVTQVVLITGKFAIIFFTVTGKNVTGYRKNLRVLN